MDIAAVFKSGWTCTSMMEGKFPGFCVFFTPCSGSLSCQCRLSLCLVATPTPPMCQDVGTQSRSSSSGVCLCHSNCIDATIERGAQVINHWYEYKQLPIPVRWRIVLVGRRRQKATRPLFSVLPQYRHSKVSSRSSGQHVHDGCASLAAQYEARASMHAYQQPFSVAKVPLRGASVGKRETVPN